jgi:RNA polymerase sigma-70 factor (ECF subfamily)
MGEPDPATAVADRDELDRGFLSLAPDQRALIALHYYVGLPLQETADALGLPIGTVKSRLHRTVQQLRANLAAEARLPALPEGRPV